MSAFLDTTPERVSECQADDASLSSQEASSSP